MDHTQSSNGETEQKIFSGKAIVQDYIDFLCRHRGLRADSARNHERRCELLLQFLDDRGVTDLADVQPVEIHDFLTMLGGRYTRTTLSGACTELRGFLRHLFRRGVTSKDLSPTVVSPRVYKHEACPRFLTRAQIDAVLAVIDRKNAKGRRDYAMILLLAVYGLRGNEVVRLRLDAIDWRKQQLQIRKRKAGNSTVYPLDPEVGEAILSYLEFGRPTSEHRQIFLSSIKPFEPFITSAALSHQTRQYIASAGIDVERPGTHIFRYSCAQRLFEKAMPLKTIGDFLGHGNLESTRRYTKIAFDQLREVASGDGEDVL